MKKLICILFCLSSFFQISKANVHDDLNHKLWNEILQENVNSSGQVNYQNIKKNIGQLDAYLEMIATHPPKADWSKNQTMAYWINAYNAFTVKLILNHYPLKSIMEVNNGKAWDLKFITIGGKEYSLNNIEHDILRKKYKDPRIHFAVNCASISCPKLYNKAFSADLLEKQLNLLSKSFINNASKNSLQKERIKISKLFEWYKDDFTLKGSVVDFLNQYAETPINSNAQISYKDYNWNLNSQ